MLNMFMPTVSDLIYSWPKMSLLLKLEVCLGHVYGPSELFSLSLIVNLLNWDFPFLAPKMKQSSIL